MKQDIRPEMQGNMRESGIFPQWKRFGSILMVNNHVVFRPGICVLETMSQRNVPSANTFSAGSLGACAAILAYMAANWITSNEHVPLFCAAVAGGWVTGRVLRAYREQQD